MDASGRMQLDGWDLAASLGTVATTLIARYGGSQGKQIAGLLGLVTAVAGIVSLFVPKCSVCGARKGYGSDGQLCCPHGHMELAMPQPVVDIAELYTRQGTW